MKSRFSLKYSFVNTVLHLVKKDYLQYEKRELEIRLRAELEDRESMLENIRVN